MRHLAIVLLAVLLMHDVQAYRRICYYTNWAQYRPGVGEFVPEDIDPSLCSHIIYAFAKMQGNRLAPYEWNDESTSWAPGMYERVTNLKTPQNGLKVLLAVGGYNFGTADMTAMLATQANRAEFVSTSIDYLRQRDFEGLDLDFEYPGWGESPPEDKQRFTSLVQELRAAFDKEAAETGNEKLLLSIAVAAGNDKIDKAYEVDLLAQEVDWISVMTYDFNGGWDTVTGHNSPLYGSLNDVNVNYNIDSAMNYWHSLGAPKDKLIVGMATHGRGFTLANTADNGMGAPATGDNALGDFTRQAGYLSYYEICSMFLTGTNQGIREWSDVHQVPYVYKGNVWVGYDDVQSLRNKVQYMKDSGFGGWMLWDLDLDDFKGSFCRQGAYPLLHTLNAALETDTNPQPTTTTPGIALPSTTTTTTTTPVPPPATDTFSCLGRPNGFHKRRDCTKFNRCYRGSVYVTSCPAGLLFNPANNYCDWPYNLSPERAAECAK